MDDLQLLLNLHKGGYRQGPGGDEQTVMALNLAMIDRHIPLKIADIGCGTGASTLLLAKLLNAQITAVDFLQDFLDVMMEKAEAAGVAEKITPLACSMDDMPFVKDQYDVIWSEGAIYNIGFEKGVSQWRDYLKPNGLLVVSEITWTTESRPIDIQEHWEREYPEIDLASAKIKVLEKHGYAPVGYFILPETCWTDQYYRPMQERFGEFLALYGNSALAHSIVEETRLEIALFEKYSAYFSYGVYIARKL